MQKILIGQKIFEQVKKRIIKKEKEQVKEIPQEILKDDALENKKLKKYQLKEQDMTDIWAVAETYERAYNDILPNTDNKPNLRYDIMKERLGFFLKRMNKSGRRTPKEFWQRIKYLSKGLTLDEWSDRVEGSWENMLEYTEKVWENFFIYSFKSYKWYPYLQKHWSDSWYGQNWRNWRREEDTVTWQINSRTPWHKHIRLSNDSDMLWNPPESQPQTRHKEGEKTYTFPRQVETVIGANRLKLNHQIFTNINRHEVIKQGSYNMEPPEMSLFNGWNDSAYIYIKYIRPWLMRLNYLDKATTMEQKYLGKELHRKNHEAIAKKNLFQNELYQVSYNLKLIKQLNKLSLNLPISITELERKFGKRNVKMYVQNRSKVNKLVQYEKILNFRQTNQNLIPKKNTLTGLLLPKNLNKRARAIFFIICY